MMMRSLLCTMLVAVVGCQSGGKKADESAQSGLSKVPIITNVKQMTFAGRRTGEGYYRADGRYWVFQSERESANPFYQIYMQDLKNGKTWRVSPGYGKTTCAWIHPKQRKVVFSSTHEDLKAKAKQKEEIDFRNSGKSRRYSWDYDENFDIYSANWQGRRLKNLTKTRGYDAEASYSPNGKKIVFASNRRGFLERLSDKDAAIFSKDPSYMMEIYIMDSNGKNVKRLTDYKGYDGGPFFSPDGQSIVWRRFNAKGTKAEIWTMKIDGTDKRQITKLNAMSWAPYYHPSGDYIVFATNIHGFQNFELYVVDRWGKSKPVRVTTLKSFDGLPVFTPDGKTLTWSRKMENGQSQIFRSDWNDRVARYKLGLPIPPPTKNELSPDIREQDVQNIISYLASPGLKGRGTGTPDEDTYMNALAKLFKSWGLRPAGDRRTYFQSFPFVSGVSLGGGNRLKLTMNKKTPAQVLKVNQDWRPLGGSTTGRFDMGEVAFVGYGMLAPEAGKLKSYDSYGELDVKNKWVMMLRYLPEDVSEEQRVHYHRYSQLPFKISSAKARGAKGVILVTGPRSGNKDTLIPLKAGASSQIPVISISDKIATRWLKTYGKDLDDLQEELDSGKPMAGFYLKNTKAQVRIDIKEDRGTAKNLVAKLVAPGARRSVVIGAHGDHLGVGRHRGSLERDKNKNTIHYGADDNASGVSGVLELAHHLSAQRRKGKLPLKHNVLFVIWSGEEEGTLGSNAFVKQMQKNGRKLNSKYSAYINMDMIGRFEKNVFIQGIGSSPQWTQLIEKYGRDWKLPTKLSEDPYIPTDTMAFYLNEVPIVNFFTGAHSDYHRSTDTFEKINYSATASVIEMVADLVRGAGRLRKPLTYRKIEAGSTGRSRGGFRIYLGTIPDYSQPKGMKGVLLSGVIKDGPAEKAGVKKGDIIVKFGAKSIENIYDYVYSLQATKPGKQTSVTVLRKGEKVELDITPSTKQ